MMLNGDTSQLAKLLSSLGAQVGTGNNQTTSNGANFGHLLSLLMNQNKVAPDAQQTASIGSVLSGNGLPQSNFSLGASTPAMSGAGARMPNQPNFAPPLNGFNAGTTSGGASQGFQQGLSQWGIDPSNFSGLGSLFK